MLYPRISALNVLLCLPLLACAADKDDTDTTPATDTDASAGTGTSTDTTTSATATDATTMQPSTGDGTTSDGTTLNPTTGEATTGAATTGEATATEGTTGDATTGEGTTGEGTTGEGTSTGEPAGLSWALDVYPVVFANVCGCHANSAGGLSMKNTADAYANLVGFQSYGSVLKRVESGDPDASYVLYKLRGTHDKIGVGLPMPQGGDQLPKEKIDLVEQWILDGAKP